MLTFDGDVCAYEGSAIHPAGDPFRLRFENRSAAPTSAVLFLIGESMTLEQLIEAATANPATAILGAGFMDVPSLRRVEVAATGSGEMERRLDPGRWVVACVTSPSGSDRVLPAATIEARPSSGR